MINIDKILIENTQLTDIIYKVSLGIVDINDENVDNIYIVNSNIPDVFIKPVLFDIGNICIDMCKKHFPTTKMFESEMLSWILFKNSIDDETNEQILFSCDLFELMNTGKKLFVTDMYDKNDWKLITTS